MLTSFVRAWIMQNTAALLVAYVLYTPIAHGITGGHASRELLCRNWRHIPLRLQSSESS